jgi:hypothetical protein
MIDAAARGDVVAVAYTYFEGFNVTQDRAKAFELFNSVAAQSKDADALNMVSNESTIFYWRLARKICLDFYTKLYWTDLTSIQSNIEFRIYCGETYNFRLDSVTCLDLALQQIKMKHSNTTKTQRRPVA